MKKIILFTCLLGLLVSCKKYAERIAGSYLGNISKNDTLTDNNTILDIIEVDKKRVSIECMYFDSYQLNIEKQRYFSSVIFYANDSSGLLEIEDSENGYITLTHEDINGNSFVFAGTKN